MKNILRHVSFTTWVLVIAFGCLLAGSWISGPLGVDLTGYSTLVLLAMLAWGLYSHRRH